MNAKAENEGRARAALKNTISDISHQLKTPLAALNIYNGIIQTEAEAKELSEVQEFSALSEQELDRIETLVQNLLKIAKFDAGTIAIERKSENLAEMMADMRKRFLFRATQEGRRLPLQGSESLSFFCDRYWIVEAIGNIVKMRLTTQTAGTLCGLYGDSRHRWCTSRYRTTERNLPRGFTPYFQALLPQQIF